MVRRRRRCRRIRRGRRPAARERGGHRHDEQAGEGGRDPVRQAGGARAAEVAAEEGVSACGCAYCVLACSRRDALWRSGRLRLPVLTEPADAGAEASVAPCRCHHHRVARRSMCPTVAQRFAFRIEARTRRDGALRRRASSSALGLRTQPRGHTSTAYSLTPTPCTNLFREPFRPPISLSAIHPLRKLPPFGRDRHQPGCKSLRWCTIKNHIFSQVVDRRLLPYFAMFGNGVLGCVAGNWKAFEGLRK